MAALRDAGFGVSAECLGDKTSIFAAPKESEASGGMVVCSVVPGPNANDGFEHAVVAGNVACTAQTPAQRRALRSLLDGL
jgi:hypothetical protein